MTQRKPSFFNLPNLFLFYRLFAIPFFIVSFYYWHPYITVAIFITAAISDFFDGYFARKLNLVNDFGKLMDPLADKILTATAFILLTVAGTIPAWAVIVIFSREFLITGLRGVAAERRIVIAAAMSGKLKTVSQMVAIPLLLLNIPFAIWFFYLALTLTVYSGIEYCYQHREIFTSNPPKSHK
jgi:CDP-diacylglycerol--glycerol-3-phosphate 3-phosphatidyltransferase